MEQKFRLTRLKDYPSTLKAGLIFFLSLLGCLLILNIFKNTLITIPVNVQELGDAGVGFSFSFPARNIVKIILLSLFHGTLSYFVFKNLFSQYVQSQIVLNRPVRPSKKHLIELILIWTIVTLMMGNVIHWICDRANWLYRDGSELYNTDEAFLLIYFADEFLSHAMIHVSYLVLMVFGAYCEVGIQPRRKMHWDELIIVGFLSLGVIIVNGGAAREGESAFIMLLLSSIVVFGILIIKIGKKLSLLEYPLICTLLFGSIGVIMYDMCYVFLLNSGLPYYPFIT